MTTTKNELIIGLYMNIVISGRWGELTFGGGNKNLVGEEFTWGGGDFTRCGGMSEGLPSHTFQQGKPCCVHIMPIL